MSQHPPLVPVKCDDCPLRLPHQVYLLKVMLTSGLLVSRNVKLNKFSGSKRLIYKISNFLTFKFQDPGLKIFTHFDISVDMHT